MEEAKRANSPEVLRKERDKLREIVGELAACTTYSGLSDCMFCGVDLNRSHEAGCLISRAKEVMGQCQKKSPS